jgi:flagellar protein FliL
MAEKAKKPAEEKVEQEGQSAQESEPKKGLPLNLIIIGILAVCLAGGGFFVWKSGLISKFTGKKEATAEKKTETEKTETLSMYELESFIVNLSGGSGNNYLKIKITLETNKEELKTEMEKRLPQFRDAILSLLSSKTYTEVKTLEGKSQIRAEIMATMNQYLKTGKITNVYFSDFIVQ